ncbi:MAG: tetratricopeptide repeat protein [Vicingaceae bacterium]
MKHFLFILIFISSICSAQKYADKDFYLIDSLVLSDLNSADRNLLDSCLELYTSAQDDTSKISALTVICDNLISDIWTDYQFVQYDLIQAVLQKNISEKERKVIDLLRGGALNNLGLYYEFNEGNTSKALEYYLESLMLFEQLNDAHGKAMMLNRIGTIYTKQDNIEKGFEYFQQSLTMYKELKEERHISNPLNNLGSYYKDRGDYPKALDLYNQSLTFDIKNKNQQGAATVLSNIGGIYVVQKKYSEALISFIKGLTIAEEIGDKNVIALILTHIGQVYYDQGDFSSALFNAKNALKIAKEGNYLNRIGNASLLLSDVYEATGKSDKALKMFKIHTTIKDSVKNENTRLNAVKQQAKYEYDKQKAVDDATHDKQLAIEHEAKEKQKIISYAIGFGLTLSAVFLLFVFNRLRLTRKQKVIIENAHQQLSEKNGEILDSITYAKRIQNAILPTDNFINSHLNKSFVLYEPKDIVAGDFYWVKTIGKENDTILFAAADCTGHGVPGAMVSVVCNNALNRSINEFDLTEPGLILDKTREIVTEEFTAGEFGENNFVRDGMDIALCALKGSQLKYAGANNPLWIVRGGELIVIKPNKQPIGRYGKVEPFKTHNVELQKNDTVYVFSDGFVDQFGGEKGKKFMAKAFKKLLLSIQDKTMSQQKEELLKAFNTWKRDLEQLDDVCVIGVRI